MAEFTATPEDHDAAGIASLDMMIRLLRTLRDKKVLSTDEGREILRGAVHGPVMPGSNPRVELTPYVRSRLEGEIGLWLTLANRPGIR